MLKNISAAGRRVRQRIAMGIIAPVAVGLSVAAPAGAEQPQYPVNYDIVTALGGASFAPDVSPPGANIPGCRSAIHPVPVVLVHGTFANQNNSWQAIAPELANRGYCVYSTTVGRTSYSGPFGEVDRLQVSAGQLGAFVTEVLRSTGAQQVDLVGHSQGAAVNLTYLKYNNGSQQVRRVVALGGANNAPGFWSGLVNQIPGAAAVSEVATPAADDLLDPEFFARLTPRTYDHIQYSNIVSENDELAIPREVAFLPAGPNVRNLLVQDFCPDSTVGHLGMIADEGITQILLNELAPEHDLPIECGAGGFPL